MQIIQPHYHAIARTAQDYERMAMSGVVAVCEPAFWAGFDRRHPETFIDYFAQISEFEPTRAAEFGIRHFCWVAVNPKEAENKELTDEVLRQMPEFLEKPTCLGVGETGLHKSTPNEIESLQAHVEMESQPYFNSGCFRRLQLQSFLIAGQGSEWLPFESVFLFQVGSHSI